MRPPHAGLTGAAIVRPRVIGSIWRTCHGCQGQRERQAGGTQIGTRRSAGGPRSARRRLLRRLGLTQPAISTAGRRGEEIARTQGLQQGLGPQERHPAGFQTEQGSSVGNPWGNAHRGQIPTGKSPAPPGPGTLGPQTSLLARGILLFLLSCTSGPLAPQMMVVCPSLASALLRVWSGGRSGPMIVRRRVSWKAAQWHGFRNPW